MENNVFVSKPNEIVHSSNNVDENNENCDSEEGTANQNEGTQINSNSNKGPKQKSHADNSQNISSNQSSLNRKSQKKRKRHYNVGKNKKWCKSFKRQKSSNATKMCDKTIENVLQNNRNKHLYTKQVMHRGGGLSKFFLPDKRPRKDIIVPPTKFLLGGNISDPLNLNSLQDEALVSMSAVTPKSSPITTPPKIDVIIPPNIYDPLHLLDPVDSVEYEKQLVSPDKNRRSNKQRGKKKKLKKYITDTMTKVETQDRIHIEAQNNQSPTSTDLSHDVSEPFNQDYEVPVDSALKSNKDIDRKRKNSEVCSSSMSSSGIGSGNVIKKLRRFDSKNKIVSPVVPQPGAWKRPPKVLLGAPRNRIRTSSTSDADNAEDLNVKKSSSPSPNDDLKAVSSSVKFHKECSPEKIAPRYASDPSPTFSKAPVGESNASVLQDSIKYQFGNYAAQYSGTRTLLDFSDVRLTVFMRHDYLFRDKDVLDIGCNVGHMTIAVARHLQPKSIVGIDVDKDLIARARRNLSFFQRIPSDDLRNCSRTGDHGQKQFFLNSEREKLTNKRSKEREKHENQTDFFPVTFSICFGGMPNIRRKMESPSTSPASGIQKPEHTGSVQLDLPKEVSSPAISEISDNQGNLFPNNVLFRTFDYAVTDESQMVQDKQQYDLILCLSLTKWIHLNSGDSGLKMTFRRMFGQLRPGGKLILEAQNWASYKKRKKLTANIYNNYNSIEFFPDNFHEYLLSPEVGFSHSYTLGVPRHAKKGFYRPVQLYIKGDFTPSQVRWSDTYHPQTPYEPMVRYANYADRGMPYGSRWNYNKMSKIHKQRDTPFYGTNRYNTSSTSRYYNPLETDSYLPSYDHEVQTRHYCFASPLYSTVWSPPASGRRSASQTPLFGSIRRVDVDDEGGTSKHVYHLEGGASSHSLDETNNISPHGSGRSVSVRESDNSDTNTNSPKHHVYAFQ